MTASYPEVAKRISADIVQLSRAHPEAMKAFRELGKQTYAEGALDRKSKELVALAISIAVRCDGCIAFHSKSALDAGASREEVVETIGVAIQMGGGPSMVYGAEALRAFDEFAAKAK